VEDSLKKSDQIYNIFERV